MITMEEKMKDAFKDVYEKLNDEQKKKADSCKSTDELLKLLGEWNIELPDELASIAAGGYDWARATEGAREKVRDVLGY